jgi:hypothetical protein
MDDESEAGTLHYPPRSTWEVSVLMKISMNDDHNLYVEIYPSGIIKIIDFAPFNIEPGSWNYVSHNGNDLIRDHTR